VRTTLSLSLCTLILAPAALAQSDVRIERDPTGLIRIAPEGTFRVHPNVLSARLSAPLGDFPSFLAALDPVDRARFENIGVVRMNRLGIMDLRIPEGADLLAVRGELNDTGLFEFVELNTFGNFVGGPPNDSLFGQQWALRNTGQTGGTPGADVNALGAWDITTGDPSVVIAVLDSGTQISHPDLAPNVWSNPGETLNGLDDDSNGYVDDVDGWDFVNNNNDVEGPFFHGTFVAGLIGARTNNGTALAGLAGGDGIQPGCSVMALGVGDFGPDGSILDDAIIYAADNGASVITLSLSVGQTSAIDAAADYARNTRGVFIDCAAGNNGFSVSYPARNPDINAIASTNDDDNVSGFSNPGPELWVSAPGENVLSLTTGSSTTSSSGTSFSAPYVAALAGMMKGLIPSLTPADIETILKDYADDVGAPGFDEDTGWGRINAQAALEHVANSDCNNNGVYDPKDLGSGVLTDNDMNGVPDQCETPPGTNYCSTNPNSTGVEASISASGSSTVASNDLSLLASDVPPGRFGYFLMSETQGFIPLFSGSQGNFCLGSPFVRFAQQGMTANASGELMLNVDYFSLPNGSFILPGDTWNFQAWFRDQNPGNTSNTTDGLEIQFM